LSQAIRLIRRNKYDLILSSAWPYTSHSVGYTLKKLFKLPLILEYGDPWAFNVAEGRKGIRFRLDHSLESRILKSAHSLVVTTEETGENYLEHYPFLKEERVYVMPPG